MCMRLWRVAERSYPADQLVEVPTILSPLRIAEQIVGIPAPRGRVQGFLPEQSSTATTSSLERISERTVEQIVDISPGGGLGQGSASAAGAADEDFTGWFQTFPRFFFKCEGGSALDSEGARQWQPIHAGSRPCRTPSSGYSSGRQCWQDVLLEQTHSCDCLAGVEVVWFGTRDEKGVLYYWHRDTRVSTYDLPPLPPG